MTFWVTKITIWVRNTKFLNCFKLLLLSRFLFPYCRNFYITFGFISKSPFICSEIVFVSFITQFICHIEPSTETIVYLMILHNEYWKLIFFLWKARYTETHKPTRTQAAKVLFFLSSPVCDLLQSHRSSQPTLFRTT